MSHYNLECGTTINNLEVCIYNTMPVHKFVLILHMYMYIFKQVTVAHFTKFKFPHYPKFQVLWSDLVLLTTVKIKILAIE